MSILGIVNRTENYKTAKNLIPLRGENVSGLALLLGEPTETLEENLTLELFWKGMRDFLNPELNKTYDCEKLLAKCYDNHFSNLREEIIDFATPEQKKFQELECWNYDVSRPERKRTLRNNLLNTEIDIVIESPEFLYIGEAKCSMGFGANSRLVLVHQLVRQYVMATVMMEVISLAGGRKKMVVPFLVVDTCRSLQVQFMRDTERLKKSNILKWDTIEPTLEGSPVSFLCALGSGYHPSLNDFSLRELEDR